MRRSILISLAIIISAALMLAGAGCLSNSSAEQTPTTASDKAVLPAPIVEKVIATTSGTEKAYYAILNIRVKNEGAEGVILVQASVSQAGKTSTSEMPVYLKEGESHEIKLTFPLVWKGGEFTTHVETIVP